MDRKQKLVVLGIIEDKEGRILVSQRIDAKIPKAHLKWDVPGGTNEFGESLKETLQREIEEETGLHVETLELLPDCVSKEWEHMEYLQHTLVFCYHCRLIDGKMHLNDHKINDLIWVFPREAQKLDLLPTTKVFIDLFCKNK
ncbi:MAG: NUDIX domain-containing protein [Nanoarchaeota archaeon]|nr:NUDIX domain-containing protein [Nanoarchaeota archaeon]